MTVSNAISHSAPPQRGEEHHIAFPFQLEDLVSALTPVIERLVCSAISDTVTVKDFAKTQGVSQRLVWQWLEDGVLLKAPTKADPSMVGREKKLSTTTPKKEKSRERVLINAVAWREKLSEQAVNCKYIKGQSSIAKGRV